jgi:tetratricopeptide (TPR) repeat protein
MIDLNQFIKKKDDFQTEEETIYLHELIAVLRPKTTIDLLDDLNDFDWHVRRAALAVLCSRYKDKEIIFPPVIHALTYEEPEVRAGAAGLLETFGTVPIQAAPQLIKLLLDKDCGVSMCAANALNSFDFKYVRGLHIYLSPPNELDSDIDTVLTTSQIFAALAQAQVEMFHEKATPESVEKLLRDQALEFALNTVQQIFKKDIANTNTGYKMGCQLFFSANYEEALENFDNAIEHNPKQIYHWLGRGVVLYQLERYEESVENFHKVLSFDEDEDDYEEADYDENDYEGENDEASDHYQEEERYENDDEEIDNYYQEEERYEGKATDSCENGCRWYTFGHYQEALESFDEAIQIDPEYVELWVWRGVALASLKRYEEALTNFDKAIELKPDKAKIWNLRGQILLRLKRTGEASSSYDKALQLVSKFDKFDIGQTYVETLSNLGHYQEALTRFEQLSQNANVDEEDSRILITHAQLLVKLERYQEALAKFEQALEIEHDNFYTNLQYGDLLFKLGRYKKATTIFNQAIQEATELFSNGLSDVLEIWQDRSEALYKLGCHKKMMNSLKKLLKDDPNDSEIWFNRAKLFVILERYDQALADFKKALKIEPDDFEIYRHYGDLLFKLERYSDALTAFNQAIDVESDFHLPGSYCFFSRRAVKPDYYLAWHQRGKTLYQLKRYEEAFLSFAKAIEFKSDYFPALENQARTLRKLGYSEEAIASVGWVE